MLYRLLYSLKDIFFGFNIFRYITVRSLLAASTAFILVLIFTPPFIRWLKECKVGENIRKEYANLYSLQKRKQGIPTMGGVLIVGAITISALCWADIANRYILLILGPTVWLGIMGFIDDYIKFVKQRSLGLTPRFKFIGQVLLGVLLGLFLVFDPQIERTINFPFFKNLIFNLGYFYLIWAVLVVTASSNAVNLTDGLDGLAIGSVIVVAFVYAVLSYLAGNVKFSSYLFIPYFPAGGELAIFCSAIAGAGLGFLWYNCHPADIFMGDSGSLALGGSLGIAALLIKQELLLILVGGVFVLETLSVLLQVISFKTRGKRLFLMSPLHHHFQLKGISESKVIIRFWIMAIIFAMLGLLSLKIR